MSKLKLEDVIGKTGDFGTIVAIVGRDKRGKLFVEVQCKCGKIYKTGWRTIKNGNTKSCGCSRLKIANSRIGEKGDFGEILSIAGKIHKEE